MEEIGRNACHCCIAWTNPEKQNKNRIRIVLHNILIDEESVKILIDEWQSEVA